MASASELIYKNIIAKFFLTDRGDRENLVPERAGRIDNGVRFVLDNVPNTNLSKKLQDVIRNKVESMEMTFYKKWRESKSKSKDEFERNFEKWIHTKLQLPPSIVSLNHKMRGSTQEKKKFCDLSEQQKQRRVGELIDLGVDQLLLAAATAAKHSKRTDLAYVLKKLYNDERKATKIRELLKTENKN